MPIMDDLNLAAIINTIPTAAWTTRPDGYCDFLNQVWLDYAGMTAEQAQGWGWAEAIHPDDRKKLVEEWESCLASGTPVDTEARIRRFDGSHRWFLIRANPLKDEAGNILKWYGTCVDIGGRQRGEEALHARELSWRQIVDNIPGLVTTTGAMGEVEFVNRQTLEYFGKTTEELKDWSRIGIVHPDDLPQTIEAWKKTIETGQNFEAEHRNRRADGVYRWFQARGRPVRNAEGEITAWYWLLIDIDDRKRSEQDLKRSEAFLAEGQRLSRTGSFSWCVATNEITWSEELYRIFEFDKNLPVTLERIGSRVYPDDLPLLQDMIERAQHATSDFEYQHRLLMPDQSVKHIHLFAHATRDKYGRLEYVGAAQDVTERKEAEEKLRRSEADLLEAQRLTHTCSWKHDLPSGRVSVSPEALRMFGVNSDEDTSDPRCWFDKQHPEDRLRSQSLFEKCEAEKTSYEDDYRVVLPDGSIRYLHSVGRPVLNGSGELVEFIGTAIDVTEQVQARAALQKAFDEIEKSEAKLRQVIETIPALAWSARPDGPAEFFNRPWLEYAGLSYDQARDVGWVKAVHPDDLNRLMEYWRSILASGKPGEIEARLRRFDGEYRWFLFRANPLRDKSGTVVKWYGTNVDIEDRKRAEQKLRESEKNLRTMIDAVRQYITVLAPDGKVLYTNRVALDLTGLTVGEVNDGGFFPRAFHPDDVDRVRGERQENLLRATPFDLQMRLRFRNGQYRWQLFQYNPLIDESGQIIRWYCTATDIDDQKRTEERLRNENLVLREEINSSSMFEDIVGSSEPLRKVLTQVSKVAPSDSTVLILGETGTGKELIARAIHKRSSRASRAFIGVNCAAIPPSLIASELFGHEKGAFTGAAQRRLGRFETANGGTIFLDEVGDLPSEIQIALLRVLQEREIERVGSDKPIPVDVRVVAATNRDLNALVSEGKFRQDLLYRLNVVPIQMPSLRERAADIPLLVEYFIARFGSKAGKKFRTIDKRTLRLLQAYQWPGNVRELQNVIERAVILADSDCFAVDETWFKRERSEVARPGVALAGVLLKQEKELIETALREARGVVGGPTGAAAKLGIPRETLNSKIRKLGIKRSAFRAS
jgi:formate hydrogenlyase transcriptional activator